MSVAAARQKWLKFRCNSCLVALKMFESPTIGSGGNRASAAKQYFTNCYHVLCNNCRFKNGQNCAVCNKQCNFMGCTNNMPKHYQFFFQPISDTKKLLSNVMKFQRMQNCLLKQRFANKMQYLEKKRMVVMKKTKEINERRQRSAEALSKFKTIHRIFGLEKRRRDQEKQHKIQLQQQQQKQQQQQQMHHHHQQQQQQQYQRRYNEFDRDQQHAYDSRPQHLPGRSDNHQHRRVVNEDFNLSSAGSTLMHTDTSFEFVT